MLDPSSDVPLLFVRHGATGWTCAGRYQGRQDPVLSPEGRRDATSLAERLRGVEIGLVVSSPLARARETASLIAEATGAPLMLDERLVELAYGEWEGLTQTDVKARWPDLLRSWKRKGANTRPPGGESLDEMSTRLQEFLTSLRSLAPRSGAVALVTHDLVIRMALLAARGEGASSLRRLIVPTASAHPARLANGRLTLPRPEEPAFV
jgi:broad specificity phosphatase PhoE